MPIFIIQSPGISGKLCKADKIKDIISIAKKKFNLCPDKDYQVKNILSTLSNEIFAIFL